ncbi:MAG TPA: hypothetical protein VM285_16995 [Polyangia bacterium]|nr:hypothetical protein [Polyangia bacterium]
MTARFHATNRRGPLALAAAVAGLAALGCVREVDVDLSGPLSFEVALVGGDAGTPEEPLAFTKEPRILTIDVRAVDEGGATAEWFDGRVHLDIRPRGAISIGFSPWFDVVGGVATAVPVQVERVHSSASLWVEDIGEDGLGSYSTGLSPDLYFRNPTIRNCQESDIHLTSALRGDFVDIDLEGRTAVVTGTARDGFYLTDISEPEFLYSSIYVYTFSRPELEIGSRVTRLRGTVDEFYGFTELSFPSWKTEGTAAVPEPVAIDSANDGLDSALEPFESSLVEVRDVTVCPVGESFATYGQWAVLVDPAGNCETGDGAINVVSTYTVPDVDPATLAGQTVGRVTGNLRYHMAAVPGWIVYARGPEDIAFAAGE